MYCWEVQSQVQNQRVRALPHTGKCLPRRTLSRRSLEGQRSSHPSTRSRVSHSNPVWSPHVPERWRQPRGRKWPAAGLGWAVPKQGSPGHTRPPARITLPSPARARCALSQPLPDDAVPARGSRAHASSRARRSLTWSCHRSAATRPIPGPASHGCGGHRGPACSSRLGPGLSGNTRLVLPGSYFCFSSGRAT